MGGYVLLKFGMQGFWEGLDDEDWHGDESLVEGLLRTGPDRRACWVGVICFERSGSG